MANINNEEAIEALTSLDDKEFLIYAALVSKGPLTLDEVSLYLDQPIENTRDSLAELAGKGLVSTLAQTVKAYSVAQPYWHLRREIELLRGSETKIRESLESSSRKLLEITSKEVASVVDLVPLAEVELGAAIENAVSKEQKGLRKAQIENISSISEEIKTLRKELDETIREAITGFEANLNEIKATMDDAAKDFLRSLSTSTPRDIIEKNIEQLSKSIETVRTLPPKLTETITKGCSGLTKQLAGFKSFASNVLARLDKTSKTIQTLHETAETSLQTTMKQIESILSEVEENYVEAIGIVPGAHKKKSSAQAIFADAEADVISSLTKALDEVALEYAEAIKRAQKLVEEQFSDIKVQVREFLQDTFDLTKADSRMAKELEERIESLRSETTKINAALTQETETVIRRSDELDKIQRNIISILQPVAENIRSSAAKVLRDYRESDSIGKVQELTVEIENYGKEVLGTHDSFEASLGRSLAEIMGQLDQFQEKHSTALSRTVTRLEGAIKDLRDKNLDVSVLTDLVESLLSGNKDLLKLKDEAKSKLDLIAAGIIDSKKRSAEESIKVSRSIITHLNEAMETIPGRIETIARSAADEAEDVIGNARKELEGRQTEYAELGNIVKEVNTKTIVAIEKQIRSLENSLQTLKEETAKDVNTQIRKVEALFDEVVKTLNANLAECEAAASNIVDAQRAYIKALPKEMRDRLLKSLRGAQEKLTTSIGQATDQAGKSIGEAKKSISESASNTLSEIDSTVSAFGEKVRGLIDETSEIIESQKTECCSEIEAACFQETDRTMPEISDMMNFLNAELSKMEATLTEKTASLIAKISSIATELTGKTNVQLSNLNEQAKTKSSKVMLESAENLSKKLAEFTSRQTSSIKEISTESIKESSSKLIQSVEKLKESISHETSAIVSLISPIADEMDRVAATNVKMLVRLGESIDELAKVSTVEKTWHLLSKPTVIDHLRDMLNRARATVFIEAPTLSYLPRASEFSKRKEVLFYIQVGETVKEKSESSSAGVSAQSKDELDSLKLMPNVRLINKQRAPYIVVNRDNAEILIGIENSGDAKLDATAIVSEEKTYINLVRDLIGPSLLSEPQN